MARMGLDTLRLSPHSITKILNQCMPNTSQIEEKVRRAVELERYILSEVNDAQERLLHCLGYANSRS